MRSVTESGSWKILSMQLQLFKYYPPYNGRTVYFSIPISLYIWLVMDRYLFAVRWIPASFSACRQNLKWKIWNWFQFRPIEKLEIFEPAWKTACFTLNETSRIIALHFLSFSFPFLYESYDISPRKATPFFFSADLLEGRPVSPTEMSNRL